LHNYTTAETQEIYNVVVQDPERVKDDYYYRSRKAQLMREMKERFTDLLQCVKGHRGEEKFQTLESADSYAEFVKECLRRFTPWATPCLMPAQFDGFNDVLGHLSFQEIDPDEEHQVEINRLHTLLHHNCYSRLISGIGYDSPELKLQVPQFFFATQNRGGPRGGRRDPVDLQEEELAAIRETLAAQSERRRHVSAGLFRVLVDGEERARFDIKERSQIQFEIEEEAELIEVRGSDGQGELLVALHVVEFDYDKAESKPFATSIVLEGGQKVSFSVKPCQDSAGGIAGAMIDVAYQETSRMRAASLFFQQLKTRATQSLSSPKWLDVRTMKPILATLLLTLCAALVFFYFQSTKKTPDEQAHSPIVVPEQKKDDNIAPQPSPDSKTPAPNVAGVQTPDNQQPKKEVSPGKPRVRENENNIAGTPKRKGKEQSTPDEIIALVPDVRSPTPTITGVPLVEVKRIAIEPYGSETLTPKLRDAVAAALQATNRFTVVQSRKDADAVLKISTKQELTAQPAESPIASIIALLVNAKGYAVWPTLPRSSGEKYSGTADEIAARIAANILSEIQKEERRK
jgi:hypothetical protein